MASYYESLTAVVDFCVALKDTISESSVRCCWLSAFDLDAESVRSAFEEKLPNACQSRVTGDTLGTIRRLQPRPSLHLLPQNFYNSTRTSWIGQRWYEKCFIRTKRLGPRRLSNSDEKYSPVLLILPTQVFLTATFCALKSHLSDKKFNNQSKLKTEMLNFFVHRCRNLGKENRKAAGSFDKCFK